MKQLLITFAAVLVVGCGPPPPDILIHDAALDGNIEAVKQHLAAGTDVNAKDKRGMTPLHLAALFEHKEVVELLISKGADVNAKNKHGKTPLHQAAQGKGFFFTTNEHIFEQLIDAGSDVNARDKDGATPLDLAIAHARESLVLEGATVDSKTVDLLRKHGAKTGEELKAEGK